MLVRPAQESESFIMLACRKEFPCAFSDSLCLSVARLLLEQLTSPVRWTQLIERLVRDFPGALFVEMGPGNVLTGLMKKIAPGTECVPCGTAADVESLLARAA